MKKSEVGSILQDVVKESLKDFLGRNISLIKNPKKEKKQSFLELGYYNDADKFMEEQTDDFDRYSGEEFETFHYRKGQFIYNPDQVMTEWNDARWLDQHDGQRFVHFKNEPSYVEFLKFNKPKSSLKFSSNENVGEGVGYVYDKDMKKDPKHIKGERWTIKFDSDSKPLKETDIMEENKLKISEVKKVIQELIDELWIGNKKNKEKLNEYCTPEVIQIMKQIYQFSSENQTQSDAVKTMTLKKIHELVLVALEKQKSKNIGMEESDKNPVKEAGFDKEYLAVIKNAGLPTNHPDKKFSLDQWNQMSKEEKEKFLSKNKKVKNEISLPKYVQVHSISSPVKNPNVPGEWIVKWMTNGKRDENKTYYTDDEEDAWLTYKQMWKNANKDNSQHSNAKFIITSKSGPQDVYYCSSTTQGQRLIPHAYDMAHKFNSIEAANAVLVVLKNKFKGIQDWDVEPVIEK